MVKYHVDNLCYIMCHSWPSRVSGRLHLVMWALKSREVSPSGGRRTSQGDSKHGNALMYFSCYFLLLLLFHFDGRSTMKRTEPWPLEEESTPWLRASNERGLSVIKPQGTGFYQQLEWAWKQISPRYFR